MIPEEIQRLQVPWTTLGHLVREKAEARGDAQAFVFDEGTVLTNADLEVRTNRLATGLIELGVSQGDRVASFLEDSPEQLLLWLAAAKLGAIAVPINISLGAKDLAHVLRQSQPTVMAYGSAHAELVRVAKRESGSTIAVEICVDDAVSDVRHFAEVEDATDASVDIGVEPSDPACILFTGGTTGLPKGVIRPHFSYMCTAVRYREILRPQAGDRHYAMTRLFHTGGQEAAVAGPLLCEIPSFLSKWFSVSTYWDSVREFGATLTTALGPVLTMLLREPERADDRPNPLRAAIGATQNVPGDTTRRFAERFELEIYEIYGMTETGSLVFSNQPGDRREGSVGRARGWVDVRIVDEDDWPVSPGEQGEVVMRPNVPYSTSLGYFDDSEATITDWRNLWIHTGDVGYLDEGGWLYLAGRMAHWIRRRGENVSALEVEQVIDAMPDVVESAVVGVPSEVGEDEVKTFVVRRDGSDLSAEDVIQWCAEGLAYFKVPRYVEFIDLLPRTVTKNEIERHTLRERGIGDSWDAQAAGFDPRQHTRR